MALDIFVVDAVICLGDYFDIDYLFLDEECLIRDIICWFV